MDMYKIICPYCDCEHVPRDYEEGFQAVVCFECNKPFVNQTTMTPVFHSFCVVGFERKAQLPTPEEIEEDAKYYAEHPEELDEIENQPLPISTNEEAKKTCACCGKQYYLQQMVTGSCCFDCYENSMLRDDPPIPPEPSPEQVPLDLMPWVPCPDNQRTMYRTDGEQVDIKYINSAPVRITWSAIHLLCEYENPTYSIALLLGDESNTNKVAAVNAFVRAVKNGLIEVDVW